MLRASPSATRASARNSSRSTALLLSDRLTISSARRASADHCDTLCGRCVAAPSPAGAHRRQAARAAPMQANASSSSSPPIATKTVLVPVADGTEEMEAVVIIDVLRRSGAAVTVASVEEGGRLAVTCSRGVVLTADAPISAALGAADASAKPFDLIALPGGMPGAERLGASKPLAEALRAQREAGRPLAAICAAPAVVLEAQGLLAADQPAPAHPAFSGRLSNQAGVSERVAVAVGGGGKGGLVLTSRGPGTAFEFALALVAVLFGEDKAREVAGPMVMGGNDWEEAVRKATAAAAKTD